MQKVRNTILILCLCTLPIFGGVSWNVEFVDVTQGSGVGFDDAVDGATRRSTFINALNYVGSLLDYDATLDFRLNASETDGTGALASASTYYSTGLQGYSNGVLFAHLESGSDPTSQVVDGHTTFDFGHNWNTDMGNPLTAEFDLFSVSLHEIIHTLGFADVMESDGTSAISGSNPGSYSVYDTFLERGDGTSLFGAGGEFLGTSADLVSDDLFFNGANAVAANGGERVKIYAPTSWEEGSSIAHTDPSVLSVMNPSIYSGAMNRELSDIDIGILKDLGYQFNEIVAVPEPEVVLLLAFGALFLYSRRPVLRKARVRR